MTTRNVVFALLSLGSTVVLAQQPQTPATTQAAAAAQPAVDVERMRTQLADWPNLTRYRAEDEALPPPRVGEHRVVFLGDSITDRWGRKVGTFFPGKGYINRGISGQTTPQMLLRFQQDVVHLHPSVLVLLAGTNDIARNTGPSSPAMIEDNFRSMAAIAKDNGIRLVIGAILPAARYRWRPGVNGVSDIREVNRWLETFCAENNFVFVDYYSAMADAAGGMKPGLSSDEVHPTEAGYAIMAPLAEQGIDRALQQP